MANMSKNIEEILLKAINGSKLNSREIARKAGVNEGSLSLFINGKRGLTLHSAASLAQALGLELVKKKKRGEK